MSNLNSAEIKAQNKIKRRASKKTKKPKMKVSGKSVFKLKKIIENK
ncbi:MAG: hypothetical protein V1898_02365 [Patescibacteria group bacterium]